MERIQTDTKAGEIARLRDFVVTFGKADDYDGDATIARIYPAVEMVKTENGNLEVCQYNGLVTLHVGDVLRREDIAAVKEAAAILPMTMAAFTGGDGSRQHRLQAQLRSPLRSGLHAHHESRGAVVVHARRDEGHHGSQPSVRTDAPCLAVLQRALRDSGQ